MLAVVSAPGASPAIVSLRSELTVGRASNADARDPSLSLTLPDRLLSKVHARFQRTAGGGWVVEDAGSLNGTWVDAQRVAERGVLSDGSAISFGSSIGIFRTVPAEAVGPLADELREPIGPVPTLSPRLAIQLARLRKVARAGGEILLLGETGVGKEVYAQAIHRISGRQGRFVAVNCAAIPSELAESELFGYVRGAHSTATDAKMGLLQAAHGGTLFLDELGDLSQPLQAKLLRALEQREVVPLGSTAARTIDVQVVAAAARLQEGRGEGMLRPDLVARLGVEPFEIAPLRHRMEDLALLVPHFLKAGLVREIEPAALRALFLYKWPRNVRELKKTLAHACALASGSAITTQDLPPAFRQPASSARPVAGLSGASRRSRSAPSRQELELLLEAHAGNVAQVARKLDRRWHVVWRWMTKHQIEPDRFRQ